MLLVTAMGVVGIAVPCLACSCVEASRAEHFAEADVVFTGVVQAIEEGDGTVATFKVTSVEKGGAAPEQEVVTEADEAACGVTFVDGDRFQVYASRGEDGRYHTTLCSGTTSMDAKQKPYVSTEGRQPTASPGPTEPPTREELIAGLPPAMREQVEAEEARQAAKARRDYIFAAGLWAVIVTVIVLLWRRRRRKLRSAS